MFRTLIHLLSALSLLVSLAAAGLWLRSGGDGDYLGWKRQQAQGRDWVQDEWSAKSHAGRLVIAAYSKTTAASGKAKSQIRSGEEGFFWKNAAEKSPAAKATTEKNFIDIQRKDLAPTTAPASEDPSAVDSAKGRVFAIITETTPTTRTRGVSLSHWLFIAVTGGVAAAWFGFTALRRKSGEGSGDRVPLGARAFSTAASVSILLAFALGVAWLKSWYVGDRLSWRDASRPQFVDIHSGKGELVVHFRRVDARLALSSPDLISAPNGFNWRQDADASVGYTPKTFCFEHENRKGEGGANRSLTVAAPYWFLVIVALVMPSWWLRNQKYGPIRVSSFGRPAGAKPVVSPSIHSSQRPI